MGRMSVLFEAMGCAAVMPRLDRGIRHAAACPLGVGAEILAQLSHFATLFPLVLSFGTTLERIAAESLTPCGVLFRSRNMSRDSCFLRTRWSFGSPHKRRWGDGFR